MAVAAQFEVRIPPHDLDAEQSVLGAVLLDPVAITRVLDFLHPEDFYRENNKQIYRAAQNLFAEGEPIDNVTLSAELEKLGVLDRIGGRAHLALLQQSVPTAANVEHYGRIVKEKAYKRNLISAGGEISGLGYNDSMDADASLNQAQSAIYAIASDRVGSDIIRLDRLLRPAMDRIDALMSSGKSVQGVPTGFTDLDGITNGFKASDLVIIAGRPSMGKTSFALNVALHAAIHQKIPVAIFSLEMSQEQLVERMLCEEARIDAMRMHRGLLGDAEFDRLSRALGPLGEAPIFIDESATMDELTLLMKARRAKMQENIGLIIIDYLQLMHGRHKGNDNNRVQEVSQISRALKGLARELKVPVIAISQLSRAPEQRPDKRPMLSDLRESGSIEQDSDMVMFVFRPEYYKPEEKPGRAEIIVSKNRNGPTGTIELAFRKELTRFENLERKREPAS